MNVKNITDGITTIVDAAIILPQSRISAPCKDFSATETVIKFVLFIKIKEYKNSFQAFIKVYIAVATIPGATRGNTILTNVTSLFAPSTLAASSIPIGTVLKNPTSIQTA